MTDTAGAPESFRHAVAALSAVRPRPEIGLSEIQAPRRLAPWAYALEAEVTSPTGDLATGRLVLLHDPEREQAWQGVLRLVTQVRAELDADIAADPLLPDVGWSWLTDALETAGAAAVALGGTVTRTSSAGFGDLAGADHNEDLQLRASWTCADADVAPHGDAFCLLLASAIGLPPVGVAMLGRHQD